jgi:hypothetical protein
MLTSLNRTVFGGWGKKVDDYHFIISTPFVVWCGTTRGGGGG